MLFPFALKQFLTSFHVDANFLGAFSDKKISLIDDNNHHMAVLLATPVVRKLIFAFGWQEN